MIEAWRTGVVDYLSGQFAGAKVVSGERDGKWQEEKDLIAVWWPGWDELQRDTMLAQPTLALRYFPAKSKQPDTDTPPDPTSLEQAADALLAAFTRPTQVVGFFTANLACRLTTLRPIYNIELWRVEGSLLAYTLGEGA